MRSSVVLMVSAFAAGIAAQANYTLPAGFNPAEVSATEKASWCTGQRNICPKICGGAANVNTCDPDSLSFSCVCSDGSVPNSSEYTQSLPYFVCEANYGQCIENHPNDLTGQEECKEQAQCGTKNATSAASSTSAAATSGTAAATTMSTATKTASGQVSTTSAAKATASTSHSAASAVKVAQDYSAALLVGGLLAGFHFVL